NTHERSLLKRSHADIEDEDSEDEDVEGEDAHRKRGRRGSARGDKPATSMQHTEQAAYGINTAYLGSMIDSLQTAIRSHSDVQLQQFAHSISKSFSQPSTPAALQSFNSSAKETDIFSLIAIIQSEHNRSGLSCARAYTFYMRLVFLIEMSSSTGNYYTQHEETFKAKEVSLPVLHKWYGLGKKLLYLAYGEMLLADKILAFARLVHQPDESLAESNAEKAVISHLLKVILPAAALI
ncbi:hypothetical protein K488DRAFT_75443, partial [Vararia minispora EC-137]